MINIPYKPYREQYRVLPSRHFNGDSSEQRNRDSQPHSHEAKSEENSDAQSPTIPVMAHNPVHPNYRVVSQNLMQELKAALSPILQRAHSSYDGDQAMQECISILVFFYVHSHSTIEEGLTTKYITKILQLTFDGCPDISPVVDAVFSGFNKQSNISYHRFQTMLMSLVSATTVLSIDTIYAVILHVFASLESLNIKKRSDKERLLRQFSSKLVRHYSKKRMIVLPTVMEATIQSLIGFMDRSFSERASMHQLCDMMVVFLGDSDVVDAHTYGVFSAMKRIKRANEPDNAMQKELQLAWQAYCEAHIQMRSDRMYVSPNSEASSQRHIKWWRQCLHILEEIPELSHWAMSWLDTFSMSEATV